MANFTPRQIETLSAINTADSLFQQLGYSPAKEFMTGLAAAESNLGKEISPVSYSPFQIDPIRYQDISERGQGGSAKERADIANKFLQNQGYGEDFDILCLSKSMNVARNPLIGALLTRMGLASIPEKIPSDAEGQAGYWKKHWNSYAKNAKGTTQHFLSQKQIYDKLLDEKAHEGTILAEVGEDDNILSSLLEEYKSDFAAIPESTRTIY